MLGVRSVGLRSFSEDLERLVWDAAEEMAAGGPLGVLDGGVPQTGRAYKQPKFDPNPIIPPDVVLWAAEQSDYIGFNPWFTTSIVGMINVAETSFLFQLIASISYLISGIYTFWDSGDDIYAKIAAVIAALAGFCHFLHLKRCFVRVFNQPED
ncbi:uncharacterized protein LOC144161650 [Haemaphysalis longicornis]